MNTNWHVLWRLPYPFLPNTDGQNASMSEDIASFARVNSEPKILPDVSKTKTKSLFAFFTYSLLSLQNITVFRNCFDAFLIGYVLIFFLISA